MPTTPGSLFEDLKDALQDFKEFLDQNVNTIKPAIAALKSLVPQITELLDKLGAKPDQVLTPIERFNLINDAWASALAGLSSIREYLDLTERFRDESARNVWTALIGSFAYLDRVIGPRDRAALRRLVRDRLGPAAGRLGWSPLPGESELTRQLRGDLLRAMGTLGDDPVAQTTARELYARYRDDRGAADLWTIHAATPTMSTLRPTPRTLPARGENG